MKTVAEANLEARKLADLAEQCGMSVSFFIEEYALDDVVPGICMNPDCEYSRVRARPASRLLRGLRPAKRL
jgi:hypothetical protein